MDMNSDFWTLLYVENICQLIFITKYVHVCKLTMKIQCSAILSCVFSQQKMAV